MFNTAPIINDVILHYYAILWTFAHSSFLQNFITMDLFKIGGGLLGILVGFCHNRRGQKGLINSDQYVLIRVLLVAFGGLLYEYLY